MDQSSQQTFEDNGYGISQCETPTVPCLVLLSAGLVVDDTCAFACQQSYGLLCRL